MPLAIDKAMADLRVPLPGRVDDGTFVGIATLFDDLKVLFGHLSRQLLAPEELLQAVVVDVRKRERPDLVADLVGHASGEAIGLPFGRLAAAIMVTEVCQPRHCTFRVYNVEEGLPSVLACIELRPVVATTPEKRWKISDRSTP